MDELSDMTTIYLRTIYELEEEDVVPPPRRIAERLSQSRPTVTHTPARMERDGQVVVAGAQHVELAYAVSVTDALDSGRPVTRTHDGVNLIDAWHLIR